MRKPAVAWLLSLVALASALLLRWLLDPIMGNSLPLVTVFGAVAVAVWLGGYGPAVVVGIVGYAACDYLFIDPRGTLSLSRPGNVVGLLAYGFTCASLSGSAR